MGETFNKVEIPSHPSLWLPPHAGRPRYTQTEEKRCLGGVCISIRSLPSIRRCLSVASLCRNQQWTLWRPRHGTSQECTRSLAPYNGRFLLLPKNQECRDTPKGTAACEWPRLEQGISEKERTGQEKSKIAGATAKKWPVLPTSSPKGLAGTECKTQWKWREGGWWERGGGLKLSLGNGEERGFPWCLII